MNNFNWPDPPRATAFPIARPGYPLIAAAAFVTAVFALLGLTIPALTALAITFFICAFFRDPDRLVPDEPGKVVSPADGKVIKVENFENEELYPGKGVKISIFMSVFNVHVNRAPFAGKVVEVRYRPGKFFVASGDRAVTDNEHNAIFLETEEEKQICFVQIAGLVARRIICRVQAGDKLGRGQRIGMICFGSRVDLYLPPDFVPEIKKGDRVQAGASVLGAIQ